MNFKLDDDAIKILRNVFEWTDLDGDGLISRADLKLSSGLKNDKDVESIFRALKESAGENLNDSHLNFEEYSKGVMNFPFLLEQFKHEFDLLKGSSITEEVYQEAHTESAEELDFISIKLKEAISLYNRSLKLTITELNSFNPEDLLEALRLTLERLRNKTKQENSIQTDVVNGSIEMYLLVRDLTRFHLEVTSDLKAEVCETQLELDDMIKKCEKLGETNHRLMKMLSEVESEKKKTKEAHIEVLEEKKVLMQQLEEAQGHEINYQDHIEKIECTIQYKEKEISELNKQLRRLTSLKTLQQIRGTDTRTTEEMKQHRLAKIQYRQSVPVKKGSDGKSSHPLSPKNDFRVQIITDQLKKKKEEIKMKAFEFDELEYTSRRYYQEITKLKEENKSLHEKFRLLQLELYNKKIDERESALLISLDDEFKQIENARSVNGSFIHKLIGETSKPTLKPFVEIKDSFTQTPKKTKFKSRSESSCFGCF